MPDTDHHQTEFTKDRNMMNNAKIHNWFLMEPKNILRKFSKLPGARCNISEEPGDISSYCYVPGTRNDKIVLVAHVDTVWEKKRKLLIPAIYEKEKIWCAYFKSPKKGEKPGKEHEPLTGLGADDRAGCMALWVLRKMGHSLLLVDGEESGLVGSRAIVAGKTDDRKELMEELNSHSFMIQFDRRGSNDLVFYSVASQEFKKYCEESCSGYKEANGSCSDISTLCRDICGVNISSGYYNEHTIREHWNFNEWKNTVNTVKNWIKGPLDKWKLPEKPKWVPSRWSGYDLGYSSKNYSRQGMWGYGFDEDPENYDFDREFAKRSNQQFPKNESTKARSRNRPERNWFLKDAYKKQDIVPQETEHNDSRHQGLLDEKIETITKTELNPLEICPACGETNTKEEIIINDHNCVYCGCNFKVFLKG
jgi:hypothetical protein